MRSLELAAAALCLTLAGACPCAAATAATPPAPTTAAPAVEPAALAALRRMSAYLATLSTAELTSRTSVDVVTNYGQRVQLDGVVNYKLRRPNGFVIDVVSDRKKRTFYYDGKQFTVFAPELGYYATAPAPPTTRQTLDAIEQKFGIELPLEDLFRWNDPTDNPAQGLVSGFTVGTATLDGVPTDQYAFRQAKVDWQIWIQKGDQPLPVKVVIVDQVDPANPAYVARLSWTLNPSLSADDFTFKPGKDAKLISLSEVAK